MEWTQSNTDSNETEADYAMNWWKPALGGLLAWTTLDDHPHATTAHRQFSYVEPTQGGILLEHGDTPRKYTVYAIGTDGYYMRVSGDDSVYTVDGQTVAALCQTAEQLK